MTKRSSSAQKKKQTIEQLTLSQTPQPGRRVGRCVPGRTTRLEPLGIGHAVAQLRAMAVAGRWEPGTAARTPEAFFVRLVSFGINAQSIGSPTPTATRSA